MTPIREVAFEHAGRDYVAMLYAYDDGLGAHECGIVEMLGEGQYRWIGAGMYARRFVGKLPHRPRGLCDAIGRALQSTQDAP